MGTPNKTSEAKETDIEFLSPFDMAALKKKAEGQKRTAYLGTAAVTVIPPLFAAALYQTAPEIVMWPVDFLSNRIHGVVSSLSDFSVDSLESVMDNTLGVAGNSLALLVLYGGVNLAWFGFATSKLTTGPARKSYARVNEQVNQQYQTRQKDAYLNKMRALAQHYEEGNEPVSVDDLGKFVLCPFDILKATPKVFAQTLLARRNLDTHKRYTGARRDVDAAISAAVSLFKARIKTKRGGALLHSDPKQALQAIMTDQLIAQRSLGEKKRKAPFKEWDIRRDILNADHADLFENIILLRQEVEAVQVDRSTMPAYQLKLDSLSPDPLTQSIDEAQKADLSQMPLLARIAYNITVPTFSPVAIFLHDMYHDRPRDFQKIPVDTPVPDAPHIVETAKSSMEAIPAIYTKPNTFTI